MVVRVPALTPELATLVARRFAILGEPMRVRLLDALHERGEASVSELAEAVGAGHANVSKHLNLLLAERMVGRRRDGSRAMYRIIDPSLIRLCEDVCAGVRQGLRELHALLDDPTIDPEPVR
jgi:DNA-binding transcriptional ArsR family regulator